MIWRRRLTALSLVVVSCASAATAAFSLSSFGDGTYRVGKDIRPGTYRSLGGDGCYWARLKSFGGGLNAILANANASGPTLVTIKRTDKGFETSGCSNWTKNLKRITKSKTRFGEGTFIVRTDIAPGTYRSRGGSSCYWARLRAFTGELGAVIANDNASGSTIVTISSNDKGFESSGCGTWSR
jgi:hypothetical protein